MAQGFEIEREVNFRFTRRRCVNWRDEFSRRCLDNLDCGSRDERFCRRCLQFSSYSGFVGRCPTYFQFRRRRLRNLFAGRFVRQCLANLKRHKLFRRCLNSWQARSPLRLFRHRLNNCLGRPSQKKTAHHAEIDVAETTTKAFGQIARKLTDDLIPILRPRLALLHELHDAAADFPIGGGEEGVDGAGGLPACLRQQRRDAARPRAVFRPPRASARAGDGGMLSLDRTDFHGINFFGKLKLVCAPNPLPLDSWKHQE